MMKQVILAILLMAGNLSMVQAAQATQHEQHGYTEIHTDELKAWYDQGKKMIVLDTRSKQYYDKTLLPDAIWLPYDTADKNLYQALPNKQALIVVYCWSPSCPASKSMADRLVASGYTNVYKYPEGLQEWMQRGFPTTKK